MSVLVILRKSGPFVTSGTFNLPWQTNLVIKFINFTWKQYEQRGVGAKMALSAGHLHHPSSVLAKLQLTVVTVPPGRKHEANTEAGGALAVRTCVPHGCEERKCHK